MPPEAEAPPREAVELLAERVRALRPRGGERVVLGIAGSPGSGKTTLAVALVAALNESDPGTAMHQAMDGFHLSNATLERLGLRGRKGAIETFDGWGFLGLLRRIRAEREHTVYGPGFLRTVDEGVAGDVAIEPEARIVVVEGNYLLVGDREPWSLVRDQLDAAWFCETPGAEREARLVDRHVRHGRTPGAAAAWAHEVDGANATLIERTRARAELVVSGVTAAPLD